MARSAVQAVQFHMLLEFRHSHEAFEAALPHVRRILELHMIRNQGFHRLNGVVGIFQPPQ